MAKFDYMFIKESFEQIEQLLEEESPEENPYKHKYAAREILETVKKYLNGHLDSYTVDEGDGPSCVSAEDIQMEFDGNHEGSSLTFTEIQKVELFLRFVEGKLGANYIDCEETSSGEEHLTNALLSIEEKYPQLLPQTVMLTMTLLNQLGILHATRRQNDKAVSVLKKSENHYEQYKQDHSIAPISPFDLIATSDEGNCRSASILMLNQTYSSSWPTRTSLLSGLPLRDNIVTYCAFL